MAGGDRNSVLRGGAAVAEPFETLGRGGDGFYGCRHVVNCNVQGVYVARHERDSPRRRSASLSAVNACFSAGRQHPPGSAMAVKLSHARPCYQTLHHWRHAQGKGARSRPCRAACREVRPREIGSRAAQDLVLLLQQPDPSAGLA